MAGAGSLVAVLLDVHDPTMQALVVVAVGIVMILYVLLGGMKGTTYVQMIKAVLLCGAVVIMFVWIMILMGGSFSELLSRAVDAHHGDRNILAPGLKYGVSEITKLNFISLGLSLVFGVAGLPHVLMRFYTVPSAKEARRSVTWAIVLIGGFYLLSLGLGFAAAALVTPETIKAAPGGANAAAPLLALSLGGPVMMAVVSAVAFATVLAVVAGLAITASASVAHDIYNSIIRNGEATEQEQVRVSRITVVVIGVVAIVLGIGAMGQNVAFLVSLAFAVAASANVPTILFSLYWRKFNTVGALASMYTGLISSLVLITLSPAVSGTETAMIPGADFAIFPLTNPGLISIPAAFIAGIIGTMIGKKDEFPELAAEMEVRSLTGVGVEAPVSH